MTGGLLPRQRPAGGPTSGGQHLPVPGGGASAREAATLLDRLDPEQRAAATLPDGPAQIIAPAGSGKTTTLVARLGVLLGRGVPAARICVVTFNREAADELRSRIAARLAPTIPGVSEIEVRTLHALARQVLLSDGGIGELVADRGPLLRAARRRAATGRSPDAPLPDVTELDGAISALKIEGTPLPDGWAPLVDDYARQLKRRGACDFDDLVVEAHRRLEADTRLRATWQQRFSHICVDEFQDVDAAQLGLVRVLAEPERNLFVVGDDDQTIYAWRLADVRRILDFSGWYPDARRVLLVTNYRCPGEVVVASSRLVAHNRERFAKRIVAGSPRPPAAGRARPVASILGLAADSPDWPERLVAFAADRLGQGGVCILGRTRSELVAPMLALARAGLPHATRIPIPLEVPAVRSLVAALAGAPVDAHPFPTLTVLRRSRSWDRAGMSDDLGEDDHAALDALVGWAAGFRRTDHFLAALADAAARLAAIRTPDAPIELVTVHGAKGREWPTVIVVGFDADHFPNRRALLGARDAGRALEEERRLAYVALTRATDRLVLVHDPERPSRFLSEAGLTDGQR
jgi:superfamily I DNA/RNA helicase